MRLLQVYGELDKILMDAEKDDMTVNEILELIRRLQMKMVRYLVGTGQMSVGKIGLVNWGWY